MVDHGIIVAGSFLFFDWVISGILIYVGYDLLDEISSSCIGFRFVGVTLLVIGVILLIVPCVSFAAHAIIDWSVPQLPLVSVVSCLGSSFIVVTALAAFALAVSSKGGGGELIPGRSYKEYHVESYSKWMQHKVNDAHNWETYYKKAVIKGDVCYKFGNDYKFDSLDAFHKRELSPFESGCCKPPEDCRFYYLSPAIWSKPGNETYSDVDCDRWDNDPNALCYDCQSCKAAFLEDVTSHYYGAAIVWVSLLAKIIVVGAIILSCVWFNSASSRGYTPLV